MPRSTKKPAARRDAEFWRGVVAEWLSSGASRREICDRFDVNANTLSWWKWLLREEDLSGYSAPAAAEFLPVDVIGVDVVGGSHSVPLRLVDDRVPVEVILESGRCLRVAPGFDSEHLARVVAVLEQLP